MSEVTQILNAIEQGDLHAAEQLLPLLYDELRQLAAQKLAKEKPGQTLEATALVHEAYLRLVAAGDDATRKKRYWDSRGHFFAAAAEAMRRILIENARRKQADKHGSGFVRVQLHAADWITCEQPDRLLQLSDALDKLAAEDALAASLVKLRLFTGLSVEDAAEALGVSRTTAFRRWTYARAWLRAELGDGA
jgi:RNA polymerase sigma factor (TIGR02999 family)